MGNFIGIIIVNGDVIFDVGFIYEVEINLNGMFDLISVIGIVIINGGIVFVLFEVGIYNDVISYIILSVVGGVIGMFDSNIVDYNFVFFILILRYDVNNVFFDII